MIQLCLKIFLDTTLSLKPQFGRTCNPPAKRPCRRSSQTRDVSSPPKSCTLQSAKCPAALPHNILLTLRMTTESSPFRAPALSEAPRSGNLTQTSLGTFPNPLTQQSIQTQACPNLASRVLRKTTMMIVSYHIIS